MMFFAKFLLVLWCMYTLNKVYIRCARFTQLYFQVCKTAQNNNPKRRNNLRHNYILIAPRSQENVHT